jgi:MFS superfamily sulfate permease-like transporter
LQSRPQQTRLIVLEATGIVEIDFTAAQILNDTIRACRAAGADFIIARLESIRAQEALERSGIMQLLAADRLFHSVEEAIRAWRGQSRAK